MSAGTPTSARSVSLTVTRKVVVAVLVTSSLSTAWHVTTVVPIGNVEPEAGLHVTGGGLAGSSSRTNGDWYLTIAPEELLELTVMSFSALSSRSSSQPVVTPAPYRKTD